MNIQTQTSERLTKATPGETYTFDRDELARCSFSPEEMAALRWLRHWYQNGGSDRMELVRHWEFLKWLLTTGKLAV